MQILLAEDKENVSRFIIICLVLIVNNEKLFEVEGQTFKEAGKIGLWTKADSVTYFDDLRVTAK